MALKILVPITRNNDTSIPANAVAMWMPTPFTYVENGAEKHEVVYNVKYWIDQATLESETRNCTKALISSDFANCKDMYKKAMTPAEYASVFGPNQTGSGVVLEGWLIDLMQEGGLGADSVIHLDLFA